MRKSVSLLLVLVLLLAAAPSVLADEAAGDHDAEAGDDIISPDWDNFGTDWYSPGMFTDVPEGAWYEDALEHCYDAGIVEGVTDTAFSPNGPVTVAQAIAFAARTREYFMMWTSEEFVEGAPWYQVYVDYALDTGIITAGQFADYNAPATRRDVAVIMRAAIDFSFDELCPEVCGVADGVIPDVEAGDPGYDAIYDLYRAGVLTGTGNGSFNPNAKVTRAETVAILGRIISDYERPIFLLTGSGMYNVYVGGLGFKIPKGFTLEYWYDDMADLYAYDENGDVSAYIQIISMPYPITQEAFDEKGKELLSGSLSAAGVETGGGEPVISDSAIAGLHAYSLTRTYEIDTGVEQGLVSTLRREELAFNPNNGTLVRIVFSAQEETAASFMPAYESMLAGAVVDENNVGGEVNEELEALMDKVVEFVPQYFEFAQRFSETLKKELPDLYDELMEQTTQLIALVMELSEFDTSDLTKADAMYLMGRVMELISSIPGAEESLEGVFNDLGLGDLITA